MYISPLNSIDGIPPEGDPFPMARFEQNVLDSFGVMQESESGEWPFAGWDNYDKISIFRSNAGGLICIAPLSEPFSFSATPSYTTFGDTVKSVTNQFGWGKFATQLRSLSQYSVMSAERKMPSGGIEGAKLYKGVSDMKYDFKFRMFEGVSFETGSKDVAPGGSLYPLIILSQYCLPNLTENTLKSLRSIFTSLSKAGQEKGFWKKVFNGAKAAFGTVKMNVDMAVEGLADAGSFLFGGDADIANATYPSDMFSTRTKNCIDIEVSNVCSLENMVVTSFSAKLSREILSNGLPVYTDYTLSVTPIVQPSNQEVQDRYFYNLNKNIAAANNMEWLSSSERASMAAAEAADNENLNAAKGNLGNR